MSDIEKRVLHLVAEHLGVEEKNVVPACNLYDDLGADSLDSVELLMGCEEEFDMEISDMAANDIKTVQDIIDYVTKKLQQA